MSKSPHATLHLFLRSHSLFLSSYFFRRIRHLSMSTLSFDRLTPRLVSLNPMMTHSVRHPACVWPQCEHFIPSTIFKETERCKDHSQSHSFDVSQVPFPVCVFVLCSIRFILSIVNRRPSAKQNVTTDEISPSALKRSPSLFLTKTKAKVKCGSFYSLHTPPITWQMIIAFEILTRQCFSSPSRVDCIWPIHSSHRLVVFLCASKIKIFMLNASNVPPAAHRWRTKATSIWTINCIAIFMRN